jgi:hypothetical protein
MHRHEALVLAESDPQPMLTHERLRSSLRAGWVLGLALVSASALPAPPRAEPVPGDYRVVAGRVDRGTYTGWRLYHSACHGCHGMDALGSDLAPNLVEAVKALTPRAFATLVLTRYRLVQPAADAKADDRNAALEALIQEVMRPQRGEAGLIAMPTWDDNPRVKPHVLDLYAYLSARADGKLGTGKPRLAPAR